MKTLFSGFCFLLIGLLSYSQGIIHNDTVISKTIRIGETFDLQFEHLPGAGYLWEFSGGCDSTEVSIKQINKQPEEGNQPIVGKYVYTNRYIGLKKGTYRVEYAYGRPWLQEHLYHCILEIFVKKTGCSNRK